MTIVFLLKYPGAVSQKASALTADEFHMSTSLNADLASVLCWLLRKKKVHLSSH